MAILIYNIYRKNIYGVYYMLKIILIIIAIILYTSIGVGIAMWSCDYRNVKFHPDIGGFFIFMIFWPIFLLGSIVCLLIEYFLE